MDAVRFGPITDFFSIIYLDNKLNMSCPDTPKYPLIHIIYRHLAKGRNAMKILFLSGMEWTIGVGSSGPIDRACFGFDRIIE